MSRTVQIRARKMKPWRAGPDEPWACGFCSIAMAGGRVAHHLCPGKRCPCAQAGHPEDGNPGPLMDALE